MCRAIIFRTLGLSGDVDTRNEAKRLFAKHLQGDVITADLRSAVYASVLVDGDESIVNQFIHMHDSCDLQEEQKRISTAFGVVANQDMIHKVLAYAIAVIDFSNCFLKFLVDDLRSCSLLLSD
jgi:hypothetical protein